MKTKLSMNPDKKFSLSNYVPFVISTFLYIIFCTFFLLIIIKQNNYNFVYPLDDTYIHMAIAKNFSEHGIWGIDKYNFTSTSSSPLWTLLLSLIYEIFGVNDYAPLVLNFIIGLLLLFYINYFAKLINLNNYETLTLLIMVIFLLPLILLTFLGLEHTLHCFLILLFINMFILYNNTESYDKNFNFNKMLVIIPFLVMTRYESLFLIFAIFLVILYKKNFLDSLKIFIITFFSVSIYGYISIRNGWSFFPNSLLMKSNFSFPPQIDLYLLLIKKSIKFLTQTKALLFIVLPLLFLTTLIKINFKIHKDAFIYFFILALTIVLHFLFAKFGWLYRYETYLIILGFFLIFFITKKYVIKINPFNSKFYTIINKLILNLLLILIAYNFFIREFYSLSFLPKASKNIYQQQFQMANFIRKYFNDYSIALNDIGAVCYYSNIKCVDLFGLANLKIFKSKKQKLYDTNFINYITQEENVKLAIIYDSWFVGNLSPPNNWIKIGEWKIFNNIICGSDIVSFYVLDKSLLNDIKVKFSTYSRNLPDGISYNIFSDNQ